MDMGSRCEHLPIPSPHLPIPLVIRKVCNENLHVYMSTLHPHLPKQTMRTEQERFNGNGTTYTLYHTTLRYASTIYTLPTSNYKAYQV